MEDPESQLDSNMHNTSLSLSLLLTPAMDWKTKPHIGDGESSFQDHHGRTSYAVLSLEWNKVFHS